MKILVKIMTASAKEETSSQLCQSCGLCCIGVACDVALVSRSQDMDFIAEIPIRILIDQGGDQLVLKLPCPVFDGQCSKYTVRPIDCKTFECKVLKAYQQSKRTFEQSREIISNMMQGIKRLHVQFIKLNPERMDVSETEVYSIISEAYSDIQLSSTEKLQFRRDYSEYFFLLFLRKRYFDH